MLWDVKFDLHRAPRFPATATSYCRAVLPGVWAFEHLLHTPHESVQESHSSPGMHGGVGWDGAGVFTSMPTRAPTGSAGRAVCKGVRGV